MRMTLQIFALAFMAFMFAAPAQAEDKADDMATIDDLKSERTDAKRAVTMAARRLINGVSMKMDSVGDMAKELDASYCDFMESATEYSEACKKLNVGNEYMIVNGISLIEYESQVCHVYQEAISKFREYLASHSSAGMLSGGTAPCPKQTGSSLLNNSSHLSSEHHVKSSPPVHLKKRDVPKFSGTRKDWPEFKAIWSALVVPSLLNQTALAAELKLACKEGLAYPEISFISAGSVGAYDKMWDALCEHYDNITLSVSSAIDEIRYFKHVPENNYDGVVALIRQVESIYQQLEVLDKIHLISNREVNLMMSFFPPSIRKDWAEHHYHLDTVRQLSPFQPLHDFLIEKLKITKHLVDTQ